MSPRSSSRPTPSRRRGAASALTALVVCALAAATAPEPRVETLPTAGLLDGPDGAALDRQGNLFVANYGNGKGTTVVRVSPQGKASVYVRELDAPDGLAVDTLGRLFVSNFTGGTVVRVSARGEASVWAVGLDHPSGLAFGPSGDLYVSNFGNYDGTTVSRVTPDGHVSLFARGFSAPIGLAFDRAGRLYVASFGSGEIHRVSATGESTVFARIPNTPRAMLQYLAIDGGDTLYVASYGHHRVYRVAPDGRVSTFAGTGTAGAADGPASTAQFDGPNSIVRAADGTFYVTDYNASRLRRIRPSG